MPAFRHGREAWPDAVFWHDRLIGTRKQALIGLAGLNLAVGGAMLPAALRLERATRGGIVAFELAGSERRAHALLRAWGRDGRRAARRLQWLDFAYLATYAPFLRLATLASGERLGRRGHVRLAALSPAVARAQLAAGAFDAVENTALLAVLAGARGDGLPRLAFGCATAKFALLGAGGLQLLAALLLPAPRTPASRAPAGAPDDPQPTA